MDDLKNITMEEIYEMLVEVAGYLRDTAEARPSVQELLKEGFSLKDILGEEAYNNIKPIDAINLLWPIEEEIWEAD